MPTSFYSEQTPVSSHLKIVEMMISSDFSFLADSTSLDPSSSSTPALPNKPSSSGSTSVSNKIGVDAAYEECTDFVMVLAVEDVITFEQQCDEDKALIQKIQHTRSGCFSGLAWTFKILNIFSAR